MWGPVTWILFHSLAAKINSRYFNEERSNLIHYIRSICRILPCPNCAQHAIQNLVNIDKIKTKRELEVFLFNLHNTVNARKKVPIPDISIIEQYKTVNLNKVIQAWIDNFKSDSGITKLMNLSFIRDKTKISFINYLKNNFHKFN